MNHRQTQIRILLTLLILLIYAGIPASAMTPVASMYNYWGRINDVGETNYSFVLAMQDHGLISYSQNESAYVGEIPNPADPFWIEMDDEWALVATPHLVYRVQLDEYAAFTNQETILDTDRRIRSMRWQPPYLLVESRQPSNTEEAYYRIHLFEKQEGEFLPLGQLDLNRSFPPHGAPPVEHYAYCANVLFVSRMSTVDVYQLQNGLFEAVGGYNGPLETDFFTVRDSLLCISSPTGNFEVYSLSPDPMNPSLTASIPVDVTGLPRWCGEYLLTFEESTSNTDGVMIRFRERTAPSLYSEFFVGPFERPYLTSSHHLLMGGEGYSLSMAYFANGSLQWARNWVYQNPGSVVEINRLDHHLYVERAGEYLPDIFDLSDPQNPERVVGQLLNTNAVHAFFHDGLAFNTSRDFLSRLVISDATLPLSLPSISTYETTEDHVLLGTPMWMGDQIYLQPTSAGADIVDLDDPHNPLLLGQLDDNRYVAISNGYGVVQELDHLSIHDFSIPTDPIEVAIIPYFDGWNYESLSFEGTDLLMVQSHIVVDSTTGPEGIRVNEATSFDCSVWESPSVRWTVQVGSGNINLHQRTGNRVVLSTSQNSTIYLLDVEGPGSIQSATTRNTAENLFLVDDYLVSNEDHWINIYDLSAFWTRVDDPEPGTSLPTTITLHAAYPNPFNSSTILDYTLPVGSTIRLDVVDLLGRQVRLLDQRFSVAGRHSVYWDGLSDQGFPLASGSYLIRLNANNQQTVRKVTLLK